MAMMDLLEVLRDALANIDGIVTCKIGMEDNICPDDYPIIRIVPSRLRNGITVGERRAEVIVYFGLPIAPFDDVPDDDNRVRLEKIYAAMFVLEEQLRNVIYNNSGKYIETITDEDRLETYKLMAIRAEVEG
jgi:hypothetical protein